MILLNCLWSEKLFLNTIKAQNLNNQFPKNVVCTFRDIKCKVEFLAQVNVTNYAKDFGSEYIEQMTFAVGSLMLKPLLLCIRVY